MAGASGYIGRHVVAELVERGHEVVAFTRPRARTGATPPMARVPAITPRDRGEMLFELCGRAPRYRRIPLTVFKAIIPALDVAARILPALRDKAEFARIGRFYATEPMLVRDPASGRYHAEATPAYGTQTLRAFYSRVLIEGLAGRELGDQALF